LLIVATLGGSLALYHLAIRPFLVPRFLFGLKSRLAPA